MSYGCSTRRLHWKGGKGYRGTGKSMRTGRCFAKSFQEASRRREGILFGEPCSNNHNCKEKAARSYAKNRLRQGVTHVHVIGSLTSE